jgi:hypothetical protein
MHMPMMGLTQKNTVIHTGLTPVSPVSAVMGVAQSWWPATAGERAPAVPGNERATDRERDSPHDPSDVERFRLPTQHDGNDLRIRPTVEPDMH